jgi:DNA polymerase
MIDSLYLKAMLRLKLEMDQALGVTDAPWGSLPTTQVEASSTSASAAMARHVAAGRNPLGSRGVPTSVPAPVRGKPAADTSFIAARSAASKAGYQDAFNQEDAVPVDFMRSKLSQPMPPPPADRAAALIELAADAQKHLSAYLDEIATRTVFGEGDPNAALMFVGEGPGAEEDKQGRPFVGRSGQLLDKMIQAMGLSRQVVYIANIAKLRAADRDAETGRLKDRPPTDAEVRRGIDFLDRQIEIISPKVLVTLGATALRYMIGRAENVTSARGTWQAYRGLPLMPTYHPSFLLRAYTPENRAKVWDDLQQVMKKLNAGD